MSLTVTAFDALPAATAGEMLAACCGATRWVSGMLAHRPFGTFDGVTIAADGAWRTLEESDWREAFAHHPRIGETSSGTPQGDRGRAWSAGEQAGVAAVKDDIRTALTAVNAEYEARFGYLYIVCASGKSASELLAIARQRLTNDPGTEILVAAEELRRITHLRLGKLLAQLPGEIDHDQGDPA